VAQRATLDSDPKSIPRRKRQCALPTAAGQHRQIPVDPRQNRRRPVALGTADHPSTPALLRHLTNQRRHEPAGNHDAAWPSRSAAGRASAVHPRAADRERQV